MNSLCCHLTVFDGFADISFLVVSHYVFTSVPRYENESDIRARYHIADEWINHPVYCKIRIPPELLVFEDRKTGNKALHKEPVIIRLAGFDLPLGKFQRLKSIPKIICRVGKTINEYQ
jgi:hypothetical protein